LWAGDSEWLIAWLLCHAVDGHELNDCKTTTTTTTVLRPFFQDHLGEPMPEENFWTLYGARED